MFQIWGVSRHLLIAIAVAALYFVVSSLTVMLNIGIGGANLVWIPAGIAVAAVLLHGNRMTLPVFLAASAIHYMIHAGSLPQAQLVLLAVITAAGTALQPYLLSFWLKRQKLDAPIQSFTQCLRFVLTISVGSVVSASIGSLMQITQDVLASEDVGVTWLTWWVGDLSGILTVVPLLLAFRHSKSHQRSWSMLSLSITGIGCAFTLTSAFIVKHLDHISQAREFHSSSSVIGEVMQRALDLSLSDLRSVQMALYDIEISNAEFQEMSIDVLSHNPVLRSVSWAPRLTPSQLLLDWGNATNDDNTPRRPFDLDNEGNPVPLAEATEYFPLRFIAPETESRAAIGLNLLSTPKRREALERARQLGRPQASEAFQLIEGSMAIGVYWPVYRNEFRHQHKERTTLDLRGFVGATIEISRLADQTLKPFIANHRGLWLLDMTRPAQPQVLFQNGSHRVAIDANLATSLSRLRKGLHFERQFDFGGRTLLLVIRPDQTNGSLQAQGQFWGIIIIGLSGTLLMALYLFGRQRSEEELRARDTRLLAQNAVLASLNKEELSDRTPLDEKLRQLIKTTAETLDVERCSIWLLDSDKQTLVCRQLYTTSRQRYETGLSISAQDCPQYFASLVDGRGFAADRAQTDPRTVELRDSYLIPHNITAILDVPIRSEGDIIGVLCNEHIGPPRVWLADEQTFASSIGDLSSLAFETESRRNAEQALREANQLLEKRIEERTEDLRVANERLRQLDQLKSMFIASMSHELRTPLNSIIGFSGVILQGMSGPLQPKQEEQLRRVYNSARHLLALITDVIDISKIEAGYVEVYFEPVELQALVEETLGQVQAMREEKHLGLECRIDPLTLTTDRKRLTQCLLNLLSNAVKYSEQGTLRINSRIEEGHLLLEVADEGIGISATQMEKLFQPFERIDSHLRIKTPGTGLGLYLTRKICTDLLQGDIFVRSQVGQGSVFTLRIPITPQCAIKHDGVEA